MRKVFKTTLLVSALPLALFLSPVNAAKKDGYRAKIIAKYDKDGDGLIKEAEASALREDFNAEPTGWLSKLDKNRNGELDESEIKAIRTGRRIADSETESE